MSERQLFLGLTSRPRWLHAEAVFPRKTYEASCVGRLVKIADAKRVIVAKIQDDMKREGVGLEVDPTGASDPGKFVIGGFLARVVRYHSGLKFDVNPDWQRGKEGPPAVNGEAFQAYAIPWTRQHAGDHVTVDYSLLWDFQVMKWTHEYKARGGSAERSDSEWAGHILWDGRTDTGLFRWVDDPKDEVVLRGWGRELRRGNIAQFYELGKSMTWF